MPYYIDYPEGVEPEVKEFYDQVIARLNSGEQETVILPAGFTFSTCEMEKE